MKKACIFLFILFISLVYCQTSGITLKIVDAENTSPLPNAKVITPENDIFYTNDDGKVIVPSHIKTLIVSAPSYEEQQIKLPSGIVKLKPVYQDIEKIQITAIDAKQLLKNTLTDYLKIYYSKPSLYYGTIKQKAYMDGAINNLLVADISIWSLANAYNFKAKDNTDSFVQMGLNNIKYYKTKKYNADYPFNTDAQIIPKDFIATLFFNSQLVGILNNTKDEKMTAKLMYENSNIQIFLFETKSEMTQVVYKGRFTYSKNDKAIIYFDVSSEGYETKHINKSKNGDEYTVANTGYSISYDFSKNNNRYIPSSVKSKSKGYALYKDKKVPFEVKQEITLQKFQEADNRGVKNKINLTKILTDNIPDKEIKESNLLLSQEEQKFIDEP